MDAGPWRPCTFLKIQKGKAYSLASYLTTETGTIRKKWKNRLPVALLYPNAYPIAISNLGFQLVYQLLNRSEAVVCERFVYPGPGQPFRSLESSRPLTDFPLVFGSVSFEEDFPRLAGMLAAGNIEPYAVDRSVNVGPGAPLVILGGVGVFMNPEPLAAFADIMVIGEAEPLLEQLLLFLAGYENRDREQLLLEVGAGLPGCYIPGQYTFVFDQTGRVCEMKHHSRLSARVAKQVQQEMSTASSSVVQSTEAELGMYMTELGRGCSRGCRFCAAGFIYRPPRLWDEQAVLKALEMRHGNVNRIGLLGMEMANEKVLARITEYLHSNSCQLSFSSLRADRISEQLLALLADSKLKSVAIAPDGCSERLRSLINKGLKEDDLLNAAQRLVEAGIFNLKLYVMIGLPTETEADLDELIQLIKKIRERILPIGRQRGRVSQLTLSVNSFVPKPWTPFQYCSFGGLAREEAEADNSVHKSIMALKSKIKYLRRALHSIPNLRLKTDHPERVLQQAVFARADRRIGPVLLDIGMGTRSFKQAMKTHGLSTYDYAVRPREGSETMCWEVVDHGIRPDYLWAEYTKAMDEKMTEPCDTVICRRCGVCNEPPAA